MNNMIVDKLWLREDGISGIICSQLQQSNSALTGTVVSAWQTELSYRRNDGDNAQAPKYVMVINNSISRGSKKHTLHPLAEACHAIMMPGLAHRANLMSLFACDRLCAL